MDHERIHYKYRKADDNDVAYYYPHNNKLELIKSEIAKVRKDFGYPPLVTPASQIIGAQSMLNVVSGEDYSRLSNESIKLVQGKYGIMIPKKSKTIPSEFYYSKKGEYLNSTPSKILTNF